MPFLIKREIYKTNDKKKAGMKNARLIIPMNACCLESSQPEQNKAKDRCLNEFYRTMKLKEIKIELQLFNSLRRTNDRKTD